MRMIDIEKKHDKLETNANRLQCLDHERDSNPTMRQSKVLNAADITQQIMYPT